MSKLNRACAFGSGLIPSTQKRISYPALRATDYIADALVLLRQAGKELIEARRVLSDRS